MTSIREARDAFEALERKARSDLERLRSESERVHGAIVGLRAGVLDSFRGRYGSAVPSPDAALALDARLGGILGTESRIDGIARSRVEAETGHQSAVQASQQAGERYQRSLTDLEARDAVRREREAESAAAASVLERVDEAFMQVHALVAASGLDEAKLRNPGLMMFLGDVRAARGALKRFGAAGRDYFSERDAVYAPALKASKDAALALEKATEAAATARRTHVDDAAKAHASDKARGAARDRLSLAAKAADRPMPSLRDTAAARVSAMLEGAERGTGSPRPLGSLAVAGLLTGDDMASVARIASLGMTRKVLAAQVDGQARLVRKLSDALGKLQKGVRNGAGSRSSRIDLAQIRRAVEERSGTLDDLVDDIVEACAPNRTVTSPSPDFLATDMLTWQILYGFAADTGCRIPGVEIPSVHGVGSLDVPDVQASVPDVRVDVPEIRVDVPEIRVDVPDIRVEVPDIPAIDTSSFSSPSSFTMD